MKVTLLRSAVSPDALQFTTSFIINDRLAIDAGSLGFHGDPRQQALVRHVLISHTHIDHVASLPIFVENVYEGTPDCITVHGAADVLHSLRTDVFNDRLWPDFLALSTPAAPFLKLRELTPLQSFQLDGIKITPVPVNHVVPTLGFILTDAEGSVIIVSDTGPTDEIWKRANRLKNLKAVFVEVTFPDRLAWLAEVSKHLTPGLLTAELDKLARPTRVFTVHLKARFHAEVAAELKRLKRPDLELARFGHAYEF